VAALQLVRQQQELATQDAIAGAEQQKQAWTAAGGPGALADARRRGEELAAEWLTGWQEWIEQGGGTVWGALWKSFSDWWATTGRPNAIRIGAELGVAVGAAAGTALNAILGPEVARLERLRQFVDDLQARVDALRHGLTTAPALPGGVHPDVVAPTIASQGSPWPTPAQISPTVNVTVQGGGVTAEDLRRARDETIKAVTEAFAEAAATTDPGASGRQQGSGR